jgi:hypothetical protein
MVMDMTKHIMRDGVTACTGMNQPMILVAAKETQADIPIVKPVIINILHDSITNKSTSAVRGIEIMSVRAKSARATSTDAPATCEYELVPL